MASSIKHFVASWRTHSLSVYTFFHTLGNLVSVRLRSRLLGFKLRMNQWLWAGLLWASGGAGGSHVIGELEFQSHSLTSPGGEMRLEFIPRRKKYICVLGMGWGYPYICFLYNSHPLWEWRRGDSYICLLYNSHPLWTKATGKEWRTGSQQSKPSFMTVLWQGTWSLAVSESKGTAGFPSYR